MADNYIRCRHRDLTHYHEEGGAHAFIAGTRAEYLAEIRRIMTEDFHGRGLISGLNGKLYIFEGTKISNVTNSLTQLAVEFKNGDNVIIDCKTSKIAGQHKRYLDFVKDANRLDEIRRGRNVKLIVSGANTQDNIYETFADLQSDLQEGDYVIVTPGTHPLTSAFSLKNGVDIEIEEGATINAQYSSGSSIGLALFTDHASPFADLGATERAEIADTTKIIKSRIFGKAVINVLDCPSNKFMPLIRNYYGSDLYAECARIEYNNNNGAVLYSFQGTLTARIKEVIHAARLIDNDYRASICDLDTLSAEVVSDTFFPGTENISEPIAVLRNAAVTTETGHYGIETIAQGTFNYHLINVSDTGSTIWLEDTFAQTGCNVYAHLFTLSTSAFSSGFHASNWYNDGFENTRTNTDFTNFTIYDNSLTTV